jgi:AcrR family transcriptional regulator
VKNTIHRVLGASRYIAKEVRMAGEEMPTLPWRKPQRQAKVQLSQELIVQAAIAILDEEGLSGVSMRRIAQDLGTGPASLYAYVSNKDELLELVLEAVAGEIEIPEVLDPAHWQDQLKEIARSLRRVWSSHGDIALISLSNIPTGYNQLRVGEAMVTLMRGAGLPDQIAAWSIDRFASMVDADALETAMYNSKIKHGLDLEAYYAGLQEFFSKLPPETFPHLTGLGPALTEGDDIDRFEFGLDLFIRGLETYLPDTTDPQPPSAPA